MSTVTVPVVVAPGKRVIGSVAIPMAFAAARLPCIAKYWIKGRAVTVAVERAGDGVRVVVDDEVALIHVPTFKLEGHT